MINKLSLYVINFDEIEETLSEKDEGSMVKSWLNPQDR